MSSPCSPERTSSLDDRFRDLKSIAELADSDALIGGKADKHAKLEVVDGVHEESVIQVLESLETLIQGNADKYAKEADSAKDKFEECIILLEKFVSKTRAFGIHGESMKMRLESLEKLIEDNAKETIALKMKLGDVGKAIFGSTKPDPLKSIDERINVLSQSVDELMVFGKDGESIKIRLESFENLIEDNVKEAIALLKTTLGDVGKHVSLSIESDPLKSIDERINVLEKSKSRLDLLEMSMDVKVCELTVLGKDRDSITSRLDSLEMSMEDNAKEAMALKSKLGDDERIKVLEKSIDELMAQSIKSRLDSLEESMKDNVKEAMALKLKLGDDERIKVLEKSIDELKALGKDGESIKSRLDSLEISMEDNVAIALKSKLGDVGKPIIGSGESESLERIVFGKEKESLKIRLETLEMLVEDLGKEKIGCAKAEMYPFESIDERVNVLEKWVGKAMVFGRHEQSLQIRLDSFETLMNKYEKELTDAKEELGDLDRAKHEQLAKVEERMNSFEESLALKAPLEDIDKRIIFLEGHAESMKIPLEQLAKQEVRVASLETSVRASADELKLHQTACGEHEKSTKIRLNSLETYLFKYVKEAEAAKELTVSGDEAPAGSLDERISFLEEAMRCRMEELGKTVGSLGNQLWMRMTSLQKSVGDSRDKLKFHQIAYEKLRDLDKAINDCSKYGEASEETRARLECVDSRMNSLEKLLSESVDMLRELLSHQMSNGEQGENLKIRMECLERHFG